MIRIPWSVLKWSDMCEQQAMIQVRDVPDIKIDRRILVTSVVSQPVFLLLIYRTNILKTLDE